MKRRAILIGVIVAVLSVVYIIEETRLSFPTIEEAVRAQSGVMETLQVQEAFPVVERSDDAIYFGVNDSQSIVGIYLIKGMFGWKVMSRTSGTGMELTVELGQPIGGVSVDNHSIFIGIANSNIVSEVHVNGALATFVPLDKYLQHPGAKGKAIWTKLFPDKQGSGIIEAIDSSGRIVYRSS